MNSPSHPAAEGGSRLGGSPDIAPHDVSEPTLPGEQNVFSLEKTMRSTLKRRVMSLPFICKGIHHPLGWKTRVLPLEPSESTLRTCEWLERALPRPFKTQ